METVKVDIQKLQLLNDRIAQTIEALNQVRMSVQLHGIQHSPASPWAFAQGAGTFGTPYGTPTFASGYQPFASSPYGSPLFGTVPGYPGIQHTPYSVSPYSVSPYGVSPYTMTPFGYGIQHTSPTTIPWTQATIPWTTQVTGNGLSHSTWDPSWQLRGAQMWPTGWTTF